MGKHKTQRSSYGKIMKICYYIIYIVEYNMLYIIHSNKFIKGLELENTMQVLFYNPNM